MCAEYTMEPLCLPGPVAVSPDSDDQQVERGVGTDAIEATARREFREEVGVQVDAVEYVCSRTFELDGGARCLNVVTRCPYASGDARPREPEEVAAVHWLTAEEARAREDTPAHLLADLDRLDP